MASQRTGRRTNRGATANGSRTGRRSPSTTRESMLESAIWLLKGLCYPRSTLVGTSFRPHPGNGGHAARRKEPRRKAASVRPATALLEAKSTYEKLRSYGRALGYVQVRSSRFRATLGPAAVQPQTGEMIPHEDLRAATGVLMRARLASTSHKSLHPVPPGQADTLGPTGIRR